MPSTFEPEPLDSERSYVSEPKCASCAHSKAEHDGGPACVALVPGEDSPGLRMCRCPKYVAPLAPFTPVVTHPGDVCTCGHRRDKHHVNWTEHPLCAVPCEHAPNCTEGHCSGYADACTKFVLAKTALQAAVDDLAIPEDLDSNELCGCGHAALVHTQGAGNCLALGTSSQEDSHCLEFSPDDRCIDPHGRGTEHPETACQCGTGDTHTYGDPQCVVFWNLREGEHDDVPSPEDRFAAGDTPPDKAPPWPGTMPDPLPQVLPAVVAAYRVIYATAGGTLHAIDVPYGVNVSAIDGQLRLWHAGAPILAIQANITSTEEPR